MSEYKRSGSFGGRGSKGGFNRGGHSNFRGKPGFGNSRGRNERQEMFQAICSSCGKSCEVPFRPTGEKPVYCNDCFHGNNSNRGHQNEGFNQGGRSRNASERSFHDQKPDDFKKQFEQINSKLDKIVSLLNSETKSETLKDAVKDIVAAPIKKEKKATTKKVATKKKV